MNEIEQIRNNILNLEQQLLTAHPQMPVLLQTIHKQLKDDPQSVTLLSEEEIGIIVNGLKHHTKTAIATSQLKSKGKTLKSIGLDDL